MARKKVPAELRKYLTELGKRGGLKGGPARAAKLNPEQRRESAQRAARARWAKVKTKRKGSSE